MKNIPTEGILTAAEIEQAKTRLAMEAALNSMRDAVFIADADGAVVYFNKAFATFHKFRSIEECRAAFNDFPNVFEAFALNGDVLPVEKWPVSLAIQGQSGENHEIQIRRKDTEECWIGSYTYSQILNEEGRITGCVSTVRDITAEKGNEEALRLSLKDKNALLMEVHHRVKNNMQVISSLLRMESRRTKTDSTKAVLEDMQSRIRAMSLLHESLYRTGTFASVDLGNYLRQLATQAFQAQQTQSGAVQLECNMGPVQVGMDQAIPCGLLINELISNCFKHGFPAGVTGHVRIELQPLDTANQWRLQVSDTGVGLPDNFEEKRKNSLGLQLASDLAKQIGGLLVVSPNADKGASFTVNFQALEPAALTMPA